MKNLYDNTNEFALLCTSIFNRAALLEIIDFEDDVFYFERNRVLFKAVKEVYKKNENVDLISLRQYLIEAKFNNPDKLISEIAVQGSVMNIFHIKNILKQYRDKRKLFALSQNINQKTQDPSIDKEDLISEILHQVQDLNKDIDSDYIQLLEILQKGLDQFVIPEGLLKTGFYDIDDHAIGLFPSELTILAARPGRGKTTLGLNIASHIAREHSVIFVSLEMSSKNLAMKLLSAHAEVDSYSIRKGKLTDIEKEKLQRSSVELEKLDLTFLEETTSDLDIIINKINSLLFKKRVDIILFDYLQLFKVKNKESRRVEVGVVSRVLKNLARKFDIPIIALAQLTRNAEENVPTLRDLKESGDIEQDADVVMFIHQDQDDLNTDKNKIIFAKNRNGKLGSIDLVFKKQFNKFLNAARNYGNFDNKNLINPEWFQD